jgi:hypothetical protein
MIFLKSSLATTASSTDTDPAEAEMGRMRTWARFRLREAFSELRIRYANQEGRNSRPTLPNDHPQYIAPPAAEVHANPDFLDALGYRIREHAIDSN